MDRSKKRPNRNQTVTGQVNGDKKPETTQQRKRTKIILGAVQYLSKLLKQDNDWIWTPEHTLAFENLKQKITEIP